MPKAGNSIAAFVPVSQDDGALKGWMQLLSFSCTELLKALQFRLRNPTNEAARRNREEDLHRFGELSMKLQPVPAQLLVEQGGARQKLDDISYHEIFPVDCRIRVGH